MKRRPIWKTYRMGWGTGYHSTQPTAADTDWQETQAVKHPRTTMLKALLNKVWEITGDAVSYCENYIAGVDAQIYGLYQRSLKVNLL